MFEDLKSLRVTIANKIATVTIDHPPINLFDGRLIRDMAKASDLLASHDEVQVIVIESADPEFFIAHADVELIMRGGSKPPSGDPPDNFFQAMTDSFRTMPKITIGKVNGIARGGGMELLGALDMRFCSIENTRLSQPEVGLAMVPGGGGSVYWPALIGRSRALELILACEDFDGVTAERYGLVNRAVPTAELDALVDRIAARIARFPAPAVREAKALINRFQTLDDALADERRAFFQVSSDPDALSVMQAFMDRGGQTRDVERGDLFE